jgi:hypothetical protein
MCCSLVSVLEGERKEFETTCAKYAQEKQAVMERVQARRDIVRGVVEAGVLRAAESPARCVQPAFLFGDVDCERVTVLSAFVSGGFQGAIDSRAAAVRCNAW